MSSRSPGRTGRRRITAPAAYLAAAGAVAPRIARNREIAGLHYPADTEGGRQLAEQIAPYLPRVGLFATAVRAAKYEWNARANETAWPDPAAIRANSLNGARLGRPPAIRATAAGVRR